jgi:branched-chain amino acid transport system substrate-binding protein
MRKVCVLFVVLTGLILAFNGAQAAEPVKVGLNDVRSGAFKTNGDRFKMGLELAIRNVNKAGGLLGRPVELVEEDNQMKPDIAVQKVKKLVLKEKCEVIFHGSSSAVGMAIAQTMPRYKKLYVCIASFAMGITGENFTPYTFRTDANSLLLAKTMALYLGKQKQYKKVYMINQDYSYGHDIAKYYERFVKETAPDTEIVGKDFHPVFNKDFGPYISKVKATGADYVLSGNWGPDLIQLIIQGRKLGMKIPVAGILMADINAGAAMPGDESVGNFGVGSYIPGLDTPKAKAFEETFYKASGGTWPVEQVLYAYKAMTLYAEAVKKAGSLDTQKVIKAFEGITWDGPTGLVSMGAKDHQLRMPMVVGRVVKKTKYFDYPYLKPLEVIPLEKLDYKPEEAGWRPYKGK